MNNDMNEQAAINALKEYVNGDLYILLSSVNANMIGGFSSPYVGKTDKGLILLLFSDLDYAKSFCVENGYEVIDGVYPLSKIVKDNSQLGLEMILKIARHLGVELVDFNPGHESLAFGVRISWMQQVLNYDLDDISIIVSEKEMKEIREKKDGNMPLRFNPLQIFDFSNPYAISEERKDYISNIPFGNSATIQEYVDEIKFLPLNELIFLSEKLNRYYITEAKQKGELEEVRRLSNMYTVLDQVIINNMFKIKLYTLLDNDEVFTNQGRAGYILYTDRFKYMGEYRYKEIELVDLCNELEKKGVNSLIVTAGPGEMHLSTVAAIKDFIKINGEN